MAYPSSNAKVPKRDRLSRQLQKLEQNVEEAIYERKKERQLEKFEYLSPKEKLGIYLEWHRELNVLHGSLGRSVEMLRRVRGSGRDLQVLKQLEENVGDLAEQSEPLSALARERLEELEEERNRQERCSVVKAFQPSQAMALYEGDSDRDSDERVEGILEEAEKIRRISIESSLRLKTEMDVMRTRSTEMARNLVALNKILEYRKRELAQLQRFSSRDRQWSECWDSS